MTFVLLERDAAAPYAIRAWIRKRIALGKNKRGDAQLLEAEACARYMKSPSGTEPQEVSLPPQILKVAKLRAEGLSPKAIATLLNKSHKTIGAQLFEAHRRLGVHSQAELADRMMT